MHGRGHESKCTSCKQKPRKTNRARQGHRANGMLNHRFLEINRNAQTKPGQRSMAKEQEKRKQIMRSSLAGRLRRDRRVPYITQHIENARKMPPILFLESSSDQAKWVMSQCGVKKSLLNTLPAPRCGRFYWLRLICGC